MVYAGRPVRRRTLRQVSLVTRTCCCYEPRLPGRRQSPLIADADKQAHLAPPATSINVSSFYPRDTLLARYWLPPCVHLSICPSVCLSQAKNLVEFTEK